MAESAGRQSNVIPLSRWLSERPKPLGSSSPVMVPEERSICRNCAEIASLTVTESEAPSREEELLAALEQAEDRLAKLIQSQAREVEELQNRLGHELNKHVEAEVARAFGDILGMLEESLTQVLMPFLAGEARMRANSDLMEMIRRELRETHEAVLDIRAPASVHEALAGLREQTGVSITVSESETVEIILATQRSRFEELSSQWCAAIMGAER
jgi:hypothetical protein